MTTIPVAPALVAWSVGETIGPVQVTRIEVIDDGRAIDVWAFRGSVVVTHFSGPRASDPTTAPIAPAVVAEFLDHYRAVASGVDHVWKYDGEPCGGSCVEAIRGWLADRVGRR